MQKQQLIVLVTGVASVTLFVAGMGVWLWRRKEETVATDGAETAAVVGGSQANATYNWIGSLHYKGKHRCGAVLVGTNQVVTAAHCNNDDLENWTLLVPKSNNSINDALEFKIKQWKTHAKYSNDEYDVALLETYDKFPPADKVIFATHHKVTNATIAGWGSTKDRLSLSAFASQLQEATVPIVDTPTCEAIERKKVPRTLFCAGDWRAMVDSCSGDSGGPLFLQGQPPTVLGLVSGGEDCGAWERHGKYTYAKYILDLLGNINQPIHKKNHRKPRTIPTDKCRKHPTKPNY